MYILLNILRVLILPRIEFSIFSDVAKFIHILLWLGVRRNPEDFAVGMLMCNYLI